MAEEREGKIDFSDDKPEGEECTPPVEGFPLTLYQLGLIRCKEDIRVIVRIFIKIGIALFIMWVGLVVSTTLYYGALWDPFTHDLDVAIANRDRGVLLPSGAVLSFGGLVSNGLVSIRTEDDDELVFNWKVLEDDEDDEFVESVRDETYWATVMFPANYSAVIWQALRVGKKIPYYNPVRVTVNQGRMFTTSDIVKNTLTRMLNGISNKIGAQIFSGTFGPIDPLTTNPSVVVDPVYPEFNIEFKVNNNGENFSSYMGIIIVWIQSILASNISISLTEPFSRIMGLPKTSLIRISLLFFAACVITLSVTVIGVAFGLEPDKGFMALWGMFLLVVFTFMAIIVFLIRGLGPIGLMLLTTILILQTTTSNALLHTDMMPNFYGVIGIVLPFHHAVAALRYVIFGGVCCLDIGTNILALACYCVGFWFLTLILWKIKFRRFVNKASDGYLPNNELLTIDSSVAYGI